MRDYQAEVAYLRVLLRDAELQIRRFMEKTMAYRAASDGEYVGGMEYTALMKSAQGTADRIKALEG